MLPKIDLKSKNTLPCGPYKRAALYLTRRRNSNFDVGNDGGAPAPPSPLPEALSVVVDPRPTGGVARAQIQGAQEKLRGVGKDLLCTVSYTYKMNIRNLHVEGRFIPRLMLRFPPILAGTKSHIDPFHRPSTWEFLIFILQ